MLLKLLKYDFRAMWKHVSLIWGAALVLALVNRVTLFRGLGRTIISKADLLVFAWCCVLVAMFVLAIGFVIDRFSKGLLGSEGYLMHTLPVRAWELVASKLICGIVTWIASGVVALLSALILADMDWSILMEFEFWQNMVRCFVQRPDNLMLLGELCLVVVSCLVVNIAAIYLAIAISHLLPRFRRLAGVAVFIGLYVFLVNLYSRVFSTHVVMALLDAASANIHGRMFTAIAVMLIPAALFLAAVCWILEHKLNLE